MVFEIFFMISEKLDESYKKSLRQFIDKLEKKSKNEFDFKIKSYNFADSELSQLKNQPDVFLNYHLLVEEQSNKSFFIYLPPSNINLSRNFLWYSIFYQNHGCAVFSSFLFKKIIAELGIDFGAYIFLLFSQFLSRHVTKIVGSHLVSKNCLNDFNENQIEMLNVLKNEKDYLCPECLANLLREDYYEEIKKIISIIKDNLNPKIAKNIGGIAIKREESQKKSNVYIELYKDYWYEFDIYIAKKCTNLYQLYKQLDLLLANPNSQLTGYSLFEVGGGWRGEIELKSADESDWKTLVSLRNRFNLNDFQDVIRPLIENSTNRFAVFDESSIVLRIIINSKFEMNSLDEESSPVVREILTLLEELTKNEQSLFFTFKKLDKVGSIKRI